MYPNIHAFMCILYVQKATAVASMFQPKCQEIDSFIIHIMREPFNAKQVRSLNQDIKWAFINSVMIADP